MRELERDLPPESERTRANVAIVGAGRLGAALATGLAEAGYAIDGPLGRGSAPRDAGVVLLCVPDREIAAAARALSPVAPACLAPSPVASTPVASAPLAPAPGPLVGHCSGASGLGVLAPHEAFSLHPLMTVTAEGARFAGAGAAIAGTTERALATARELASALGLQAIEVAERDRVAYHAAASMASNFLVTLEAAAERIAATAGVDRSQLVPLVRATVENWAALGPERALTGPAARGDEETVARQRAAIEVRAPELLELFDTLASTTRALARRSDREPAEVFA